MPPRIVHDLEALRIDATAPDNLPRTETLSFWVGIYGAVAGDLIEIEIIGANDNIVASRAITQEQTRVRQYYYLGKKFGAQLTSPGNYTGVVTLSRTGVDGRTLIRTRDNIVKIN